LDWFESQKEAKYMGDEYVNEGRLQAEFPRIHEMVYNLGLQFIFEDQGECNLTLVREFYANWNTEQSNSNKVEVRGKTIRFTTRALNEFLGSPHCDFAEYLDMKEQPPYRDIRHTLCGVNSVARWDRARDTGKHTTLNFSHFNSEAKVWLKIVCSVLLPSKHMTDVTRDRVVLVYRLMRGLQVNAGSVIRRNMMKFRSNKRWRFCYGSMITRFLRMSEVEEEVHDLSAPRAPHLVCKLVDVTKTRGQEAAQGQVLSVADRQARDESWMGRMFGMAELQLQIGGRPVTANEMVELADRYPLTDSAMRMCRIGPDFQEPLDDDEPTVEEAGDDEDEEEPDDTATTALMVVDDTAANVGGAAD
jgi:hypothetical protein